jgi:glycosyltransferase involved in cell wall biosynthesis
LSSKMHALSGFRGVGTYAAELSRALQTISGVEVVEDHPDVIHYPFFDLFFHTLPIIKRKPTVVTIHDVIPLVFPARYPAGVRGLAHLLLQKIALQSVQAVITDSECSKNDIMFHLQIPKEKIHVVYLAAQSNLEHPTDDQLSEVHELFRLPEKYVLYVGDINYNKNLPRLIKAMAAVPNDIHLVMVGRSLKNTDIPEGKAIAEAIKIAGVRDRIHLLTDVPKDPSYYLSGILSLSRCYVQPSLYEGFGLPVLDAMKLGIPVACSKASSLPEVAGGAANYFDPTSTREISEAITQTAQMNASDRERLVKGGFHNVSRFSWTKTAEETAAVYRKVVRKA